MAAHSSNSRACGGTRSGSDVRQDARDACANVAAVADAIVKVVDTLYGKRPFWVHINPTQDGTEVVNAVSDRVRAELLGRIGLGDLLAPRIAALAT